MLAIYKHYFYKDKIAPYKHSACRFISSKSKIFGYIYNIERSEKYEK